MDHPWLMTGLTKDVGSTWNLWWEWWSDVVKGSFAVAKLIRWSWAPAGSGVPVVRCWVPASNISNISNRRWSWLCPTKVPDPWCVWFNNKPSYDRIWLQGQHPVWQRADVDRWIGMVPCGESLWWIMSSFGWTANSWTKRVVCFGAGRKMR